MQNAYHGHCLLLSREDALTTLPLSLHSPISVDFSDTPTKYKSASVGVGEAREA